MEHYRAHGRDLPWRRTDDPYRILVSEVMLQQTQVARVADKWEHFVDSFPDFVSLASAPLIDVLVAWSGLGYNRRALHLKETARIVVERYGGRLPDAPEELVKLPGIGPNTAGAIMAFAFNKPTAFIETNIRSAFIHYFFPDEAEVSDARIMPLIEATLRHDDPRTWYWALMDYGAMIKETIGNPARRSAHYARQSRFSGSDRQIRGAILGLLVRDGGGLSESQIVGALQMERGRITVLLQQLCKEGFIVNEGRLYRIAQ